MSLGRAKECKYNCGQLLAWDTEENYFVEVENNNEQHTRERCESLRATTSRPAAATTQQPRTEVKQAVNQDINFAILQELRKANGLLAKIAGVESQ